MNLRHLIWIPAGGAVSFLASFVFGDLFVIPVDLYYLIYFVTIIGFLVVYAKATGLVLREWTSKRLGWGIILGVVVGAVMVKNVMSRAETEQLAGGMLAWAVIWRGVVYGAVDGMLLFAFPWTVTWRAFGAESAPLRRRISATIAVWAFIHLVTTVYHLGYSDFRSSKIVQPNIGSAIMAVPTLVAANPVASPIAHVFMHVAAVLHSPNTELFLPPHRGNMSPGAQ